MICQVVALVDGAGTDDHPTWLQPMVDVGKTLIGPCDYIGLDSYGKPCMEYRMGLMEDIVLDEDHSSDTPP